MNWGLELWNRPDPGSPEERAKAEALKPRCIKLRGYHPTEVVDWGLSLRQDMLFLVRRSADELIDVNGQVDESRTLLEYLHQRDGRTLYLLDNEPNHPDNSYRQLGLATYRRDLAGLRRLFQFVFPWLVVIPPALAVNHDDLRWLAELAPVLQAWGMPYKACHLYWQYDNATSPDWGRRIEQYAAIAPGSRWIVDELGDSTPDKLASEKTDAIIDVLTYLHSRGDVEAAALFLPAGGTDDWRDYTLPLEECQRIGDIMEKLTGEVTVPVDSQASTYANWALARIANGESPQDVAAFLEHLRALGADHTKPHEYGLPYVEIRVPFE